MEKKKSRSKIDLMVWLLVVLVVAAAIFANQKFNELTWSLRFVIGVLLVGGLFGLVYTTSQAKGFGSLLKAQD